MKETVRKFLDDMAASIEEDETKKLKENVNRMLGAKIKTMHDNQIISHEDATEYARIKGISASIPAKKPVMRTADARALEIVSDPCSRGSGGRANPC